MVTNLSPLFTLPVRLVGNQWVRPGEMYYTADGTILATTVSVIYHALRGAVVHYNRDRCPTWDDSTECRCMTEGA